MLASEPVDPRSRPTSYLLVQYYVASLDRLLLNSVGLTEGEKVDHPHLYHLVNGEGMNSISHSHIAKKVNIVFLSIVMVE